MNVINQAMQPLEGAFCYCILFMLAMGFFALATWAAESWQSKRTGNNSAGS